MSTTASLHTYIRARIHIYWPTETVTEDGRHVWAHARAIASALALAHVFVPRQSAEKW